MSLISRQKMWLGIRRVLTPQIVVSLIYLLKFGARISPRAEVELSRNLRFGRGCRVGPYVKIKANSGPMQFGDNAVIEAGCFITSREGGTSIGDDFRAGPNAHIVCGNYDYSRKGVHLEDMESTSKGIVIGNRVSVGAGAMIADGARIGDDTVVLPASMVTRKFLGGVVLGGAPARPIDAQSLDPWT